MDDLVKRLIEANENGVQGCLGSDIFYLSAERIDFLNKKLEQSQQRVKELEKNLQKAFDLGQKYEHYSEHEFVSYNKKAADIMAEFKALTTNNDSK